MSDKPRDVELRKALADLPERERHMKKAELIVLGEYESTPGSATAIAETIRHAAIEKEVVELPLDGENRKRQARKQARLVRVRELYEQIGAAPDRAATIQAVLQVEGDEIHVDSVRRYLRELGLS